MPPPYKVRRVWTDRLLDPSRPDLVETPEHSPLALIAQFHQIGTESRVWSEETGGSVLEFHPYPLDGATAALADDEVWPHIRPTVLEVWPELAGHRILGATVGSYEDFASFAVGQGSRRPLPDGLTDEVANLMVAGDWVHTTTPSALTERSVLTGRLAANACRFADGGREVGYDHPPMLGPLAS